MKALVIGGGICGPVAAMALQRAGIDAAVYEAHDPDAGEAGSYLSVATNGLDALHAIDAHEAVLAAGFPTNQTAMFSGTGTHLGTVALGATGGAHLASHTIKRAHLHRVLYEEASRRRVRIEYGKRFAAAHATASGVCARFGDGSSAEGDLLIGCDGIHSPTRAIIDRRAPAPRYMGLLNFGGYTPATVGAPATWHMIFGARAFFGYVPDGTGGTVWFANVPRHAASPAERASTTNKEWQRRLIELFAADRGPAADLIANGTLQLAADNTHDLPSVPTWHATPLVIIGDAAHAPSPSSGQGASMALEDAVVLAQCVRDAPDIPRAFALFERLRRARVERIVAQGARSSSAKAAGAVGRMLRDLMLPWVFRHVVTERTQAWIYQHHIEWDRSVAA